MNKDKKIGYGMYGTVYQGGIKNEKMAVKRNIVGSETDFMVSIRELDIMKNLTDHPLIVKLTHVSHGSPFSSSLMSPIRETKQKDDKIHFVFELADHDLSALINYGKLSSTEMIWFSLNILLAVEYTHKMKYIHRDIKPSNILIVTTEKGVKLAKLGDYGLAEPFTTQVMQKMKMTTCWYRAPEICMGLQYTTQADLWSVGCVIYEMLTKLPFLYEEDPVDDNKHILRRIISKVRMSNTDKELAARHCTVDHYDICGSSIDDYRYKDHPLMSLLSGLLAFNPQERYTATQAIDHKVFDQYRDRIHLVRSATRSENKMIYSPTQLVATNRRSYGYSLIIGVFDNSSMYQWYDNRVLFQCASIFDRIITKMTTPVDQLFYCALYISIKYFAVVYDAPSYNAVYSSITGEQCEDVEQAGNLEAYSISDILKYSIYRETAYEAAAKYDHFLDDDTVRDILMYQSSLSHGFYSGDMIYRMFMNK